MARTPKVSRKKQPVEDAEDDGVDDGGGLDEQERSKRHTLALQLRVRYKKFLRDNDSSAKEKEMLHDVVENYINALQDIKYKRTTLNKAWKVIQEAVSDMLQEHLEDGGTLDVEPRQKTKRKTTLPRQKTINAVSAWVQKMGIKSKSRYITKMDAILGDSLNADEGNTGPKALAERVIQEFKDRYPDFMRILNRQNKIKIHVEHLNGAKPL